MEVACRNPECGDGYTVEPDFFRDGGIRYWPETMASFEEER